MARTRLKYYNIPNTSLRVSQLTQNKINKGTVKLTNLARTLAENNQLALRGLFTNAQKEFKRLAEQTDQYVTRKKYERKTTFEKRRVQDFLERVTTAYRSSLYGVDKGRLLAENMKEIVNQAMDSSEKEEMQKKFGVKDISFDDWNWNETLKRLESPDGKYWVQLENEDSKSEGYSSVKITYGAI